MGTTERFADSQQQEAWRAYACAALQGLHAHWTIGLLAGVPFLGNLLIWDAEEKADAMLAREMKRAGR